MAKPEYQAARKTGEHLWADCGGAPRCVSCGCDEDDAHVGGQRCSFRRRPKDKHIKLRLTLNVTFDAQGEPIEVLVKNLHQVVRDAVNNGTLTGETPATVEHYLFNVKEI